MNSYNGFRTRKEYLDSLADRFNVERSTVYSMAQSLGIDEDFDGLVIALQDLAYDY